MGVRALPEIADSLLAGGRRAEEPAVVVERGTLPDQRTVAATLASVAEVAERERVRAPAITVIGPVAALADRLAWLAPLPLAGLSVAVTRARARASELARRLEALGANVVQAPSIRTVPRSDPGRDPISIDPTGYDLVCLTSPVGVELLFTRLDDGRHPRGDARALAHARVAAIGPGTARALAQRGIVADVVPERYVAESLVEALAGLDVRRALLARAGEARDLLPDALRARGATVDVLALYDTVAEPLSARALEQAQRADYVTFTSSSTVRFFLQALAEGESEMEGKAREKEKRDDGERENEEEEEKKEEVESEGQEEAPEELGEEKEFLGEEEGGGKEKNRKDEARSSKAPLSPHTRVVSIGPVTSATLREHGIEPDVEAERHDIDGLVQALVADAGRHDG
jgi:uroporphyrinogen III methyltransferase/synthase